MEGYYASDQIVRRREHGTIKKAFSDLEDLLKNDFKGEYSLKVINILEHPELAEYDQIFATPTVVKALPLPVRKVMGDLSVKDKVIVGLGLKKND